MTDDAVNSMIRGACDRPEVAGGAARPHRSQGHDPALHRRNEMVDPITAAELTDVRRVHHPWEATATLQLRDGNPALLDTYSQHGRFHDGDTDAMLDAASNPEL